jgi:hypothetical protein
VLEGVSIFHVKQSAKFLYVSRETPKAEPEIGVWERLTARINRNVRGLDWLQQMGLSTDEISSLNPCVPGEFTVPAACYVNSATPRIVYRAGGEGTLPLVSGRWYLVPSEVVEGHRELSADSVPVARSVRLTR